MKPFIPITQLSFFSELFEAIKNDFFTLEYGDYEYINISEGGLVSVPLIIFGVAIGVVIAAFSLLFVNRSLGEFIKALTYGGCRDPKTAKSLTELGFHKSYSVRSALRSNRSFRKYFHFVDAKGRVDASYTPDKPKEEESSIFHGEVKDGEKPAEPEVYEVIPQNESASIDEVKFFIKGSDCDEALKRFSRKKIHPLLYVLVIVVALLLIVITFKALPFLLQLLDNFIGIFAPEKNYI